MICRFDDFLTVFFDALDDGFGTLMMPSQKPGTVQNPIYTPLRGEEVNFWWSSFEKKPVFQALSGLIFDNILYYIDDAVLYIPFQL